MHFEESLSVPETAGALESGRPAILVDQDAGTADLMLAAGRVYRASIAFLATREGQRGIWITGPTRAVPRPPTCFS